MSTAYKEFIGGPLDGQVLEYPPEKFNDWTVVPSFATAGTTYLHYRRVSKEAMPVQYEFVARKDTADTGETSADFLNRMLNLGDADAAV